MPRWRRSLRAPLLPVVAGAAAAAAAAAVGRDDGRPPLLERQPCARNASDPSWARFCAWLEDYCGATGLENVFLGDFAKGEETVRGLGMRRKLAKDKFIFCVPKPCWVRGEDVPERIKQLTPHGCDSEVRTALHVAEEKARGADSPLAAYWQILPKRKDYRRFHPAYLKAFELEPDNDYWFIWKDILKECYAVYKERAGDSAVSFSELYLAYVQVATRRHSRQTASYHSPPSGGSDLVALADLPNGAPMSQRNAYPAYGGEAAAESFCLVSARDLREGEEILVTYGEHSAQLNFAIYGFAFDPEHHILAANGFEEGVEVDPCAGLRPHDWKRRGLEAVLADRITQNYLRFSAVHCMGDGGGGAADGGGDDGEDEL